MGRPHREGKWEGEPGGQEESLRARVGNSNEDTRKSKREDRRGEEREVEDSSS